MAGPNMELFRFGLYLLFPLGFMVYFGDPAWYDKYVLPHRHRFEPPANEFHPPKTASDLKKTLDHVRHGESIRNHPVVQAGLSDWRQADSERLI
ncbi:mitochondrial cytochrome c oxidase assembly protein [Malassezia pachydermatis]|uniref:Uncharacterized protein n=1 Tax=Malassezia pachydermatis TaxID=77020 RepID=A0A0M8MLG1_9BASI|nr:hypothetical protein Malapachy_0708 [Malassezia pachydermatis]KOS14876.1 hypothetical protein Malapachy_0708 [Malassezia pachydermatis]